MLKNDLHDPTWFFDLEWVPDAAGAMRLYELPPETTEREAIQKIWEETKGYDVEKCPRPFVKYLFSRVVSIAFLSRRIAFKDGERCVEFGLHSLPKLPYEQQDVDEAEIIGQFLHYIGVRDPALVGYNSAESDMQVLIQRALVHEIRAEEFCVRPNKPWEGRDYFDSRNSEAHLDILKRLSGGAMTPKLNDLARLCNFPGKIDANGAQVVDMWLDRDIRSIVEYNQIDTLNTYLIWLRLINFCGKVTEEEYYAEQEDFHAFLTKLANDTENGHIRRFVAKWDIH